MQGTPKGPESGSEYTRSLQMTTNNNEVDIPGLKYESNILGIQAKGVSYF